MGQTHLSFFQSSLYLSLLLLQLFPDLLQLMNVLSALAELLSQVRDFLYKSGIYNSDFSFHCVFCVFQVRVSLPTLEVFVLPLHGLQMVQRFFIRVLEFEELSPNRPGLLLGTLQLRLGLLKLLLPLSQDLVSSNTLHTLQNHLYTFRILCRFALYFFRYLVKVSLLLVQSCSRSI